MYGWIWRHLPGRTPIRLTYALVLTLTTVALLLFVVFPAVDPHLPFSHTTIDQPTVPR